jgi:hypothetical protein
MKGDGWGEGKGKIPPLKNHSFPKNRITIREQIRERVRV